MKHTLFLILSIILLSSCQKEVDPNVLSEWELVETFYDSGDGSGTYNPVESDFRITLFEDSTFMTNQVLCSPEKDGTSKGAFTSGFLIPDQCDDPREKLAYEIDGNYLILSRFCIEGCLEKYKRID